MTNNSTRLEIPPEGLTVREVAELLGKTRRHVQRYIHNGQLQAELVVGKHGPERRIHEIPEALLPKRKKQRPKRQPAPSQGIIRPAPGPENPGETIPHGRDQRLIYALVIISFGLALAALLVGLHALDVAYWIGGG